MNRQGYISALLESFDFETLPNKSSLCRFRQKISYLFFKEALFDLIRRFDKSPRLYRGLRIYATDGFEMEVPRTKEILIEGYRGRKVSQHGETYYPRMYLVHTYDVLSRTTKALFENIRPDEITGAENNLESLEKDSVTIYDRYYISKRMIKAHFSHGSYFIMRCRTEGGLKVIKEFSQSPAFKKIIYINKKRVYLLKVRNPKKNNEVMVFATNLPEDWINGATIKRLYNLRWEVENSFRDLTENLKIEQWHSKKINGIMQELYAKFWLMNYARVQQVLNEEMEENPTNMTYQRSNFKLILGWIRTHIREIFQGMRGLKEKIKLLSKISTEKRRRFKRSYPRQTKYSRKRYQNASVVYAWEDDMA